MSVEILRTRADVCAAIFADELNEFYGGTPFVEFVRIDDDTEITISFETTPSTQNLTDLDTLLVDHDCSIIDDEETAGDNLTGEVLNVSGVTIPGGYPVYLTGFDNTESLPTIAKADASTASKMPAVGCVQSDIINGEIGSIVVGGQLSGVDTSTLNVGNQVYVGSGGGFSITKPIGSNLIQKIGQVQVAHATNGRVQIFGAGRSNDLPNLTQNKVWMGDTNGVPEEINIYTEIEIDSLLSVKANTIHSHTESDITDLQNYLLNINSLSITELLDVFSSMVPTDGQVLTFDTTNGWQAESITSFIHPDPHLLGNGSTANPTYSFSSDSDTGMYLESSGDLAFSQNGVCTFEITTSNRLVISNSVPNYENLVTADNVIPNKKYVDDAIASSSGGGDVTSTNNLADNCLVRGDGGAKGVQTAAWEISDSGILSASTSVSGYVLDVHNTNGSGGGNGFKIRAGENLGDISFHIADQDDTFQIMEMEADQGHVTLGKTYAQTLSDNGIVYGMDIQHTGVSKDFNTKVGTYRINGIDVVIPSGGTSGQILEKIDGTDYNTQWTTPATSAMRPTFTIWAEENGDVSVGNNNFEFSFGNGSTSQTSNPSGIVMGVACTLIAICVSAVVDDDDDSSVSISVTNNGSIVATGGIASGNIENHQIKNATQITPDKVNFAIGDTLQFLTASASGDLDNVCVIAWFERIS
jgi:hypothetical protein